MIRRHTISFYYAWSGIVHAVKTQPNFAVHLFLSGLAVGLGIWLGLSRSEWIIIILTIVFGLMMELLNTSIESVVDLIIREHHPSAKIAKDTSAGAMLVYAVGAVVIAAIIYLPKILAL